jgi:PIN domain nuclease of toxin-antitoxin system
VLLGELVLPTSLDAFFAQTSAALRGAELPIRPAHRFEVERLPPLHREPFDRLLVAQARLENLTLLSGDERMRGDAVPVR